MYTKNKRCTDDKEKNWQIESAKIILKGSENSFHVSL